MSIETKASVDQIVRLTFFFPEGEQPTGSSNYYRTDRSPDVAWDKITVTIHYPEGVDGVSWSGKGYYFRKDGSVGRREARASYGRWGSLPPSIRDHVKQAIEEVYSKMTEVVL